MATRRRCFILPLTNSGVWYNAATMAEHLSPIDIGDDPSLVRVVEEVQASKGPRVLRRDGKDVAVVMPLRQGSARHRPGRRKTEADYEAFRSAAGSWNGLIDVDQFIKDIYASRRSSIRPPVEL